MTDISQFKDIHKNETILFVGNGVNLKKTPPELFDFPSIGVNAIHLYENWKPTYYTAVDRRNMLEYGDKIAKQYKDIPKFIPTPRLTAWKGENFFYFKNFQGPLWPGNGKNLWQEDFINEPLIYANIAHVGIKLAYFMGASKILVIGMEHRPHAEDRHFFGIDVGMSADTNNKDSRHWLRGYKELCDKLSTNGVQLINISQDTYVPENILPRDDWHKYVTQNEEEEIGDFENVRN